eukprot:COSAG04_NODE_7564_length_1106_cov_3.634558_1_plen_44_part_10
MEPGIVVGSRRVGAIAGHLRRCPAAGAAVGAVAEAGTSGMRTSP